MVFSYFAFYLPPSLITVSFGSLRSCVVSADFYRCYRAVFWVGLLLAVSLFSLFSLFSISPLFCEVFLDEVLCRSSPYLLLSIGAGFQFHDL